MNYWLRRNGYLAVLISMLILTATSVHAQNRFRNDSDFPGYECRLQQMWFQKIYPSYNYFGGNGKQLIRLWTYHFGAEHLDDYNVYFNENSLIFKPLVEEIKLNLYMPCEYFADIDFLVELNKELKELREAARAKKWFDFSWSVEGNYDEPNKAKYEGDRLVFRGTAPYEGYGCLFRQQSFDGDFMLGHGQIPKDELDIYLAEFNLVDAKYKVIDEGAEYKIYIPCLYYSDMSFLWSISGRIEEKLIERAKLEEQVK